MEQLESGFSERGAPEEILTDNDTAFRSRKFAQFTDRWAVRVRFRCAYAASGNGVVERCHRTVKVIAARKQCSVSEAVYWYNVTPRDDSDESTAPANVLYGYVVRVRGLTEKLQDTGESHAEYRVGDAVWVKPPHGRCDTRYGTGKVTGVISQHAVEVDGVPRHVRDLRGRAGDAAPSEEDDWDWYEDTRSQREEDGAEPADDVMDGEEAAVAGDDGPRRSARIAARTHAYRPCPCDEEEND